MKRSAKLVSVLIAAAAVAAIVTVPASSQTKGTHARKLIHVTLLEDFFESDAHAGIWAAKDKGYWEQQGLDVSISPGAGSGSTVQQVAQGNYTFGYANAFVMAQQVTKGADVIAVASPAPQFGGGILYWPDKGISTPKDLEGKTYIGVASGFVDQLLPLFAQKANFDLSKVNIRNVDPSAGFALFSSYQGDAVSGDKVQILLTPPHNGQLPKIFAFADYGINPLGFSVIANSRQVRGYPGLVQKFVTGLLKGWNWACGNPRAAVTNMRTHYAATLPFDTSLQRWVTFCGYGRVPASKNEAFGYMPLSSWQTTVNLIKANPAFGGNVNVPPANTLFTNHFVQIANVAKPKPKAKK
jgi:NitT/TauT family transport system substrate-binding protein